MLCDGYRVVALAKHTSFSPQGPAGGRWSPDWSYGANRYEGPFPGCPARAFLCLRGLQESQSPRLLLSGCGTHSPVDAEKSNLCLELSAQLARLNSLSETQGWGNFQPTRQAEAEWLMVIFFFLPEFPWGFFGFFFGSFQALHFDQGTVLCCLLKHKRKIQTRVGT